MLFLVGFLTFIGGIVGLGFTLNGVFGSGVPGVIAIAIALLFVWFIGLDVLKWKLRSRCGKCKTEYDYQNDVAYRQVGHRVKTHNLPQNAEHRHYMRTEEIFDLEYTCRCGKCGKVRKYKDKFIGRVTYYDGSIEDHDPTLDSEMRYDSNQRKADNRKGGIFCFFLGVLLIVASVVLPGVIAGFSPTTNSNGDPQNYYGTWYGFSDSGYSYTVTLNEDRTYILHGEMTLGNGVLDDSGSFSYKDARGAGAVLEDPLYTDRPALLLQHNSDSYYALWFCEEGGESYFEMADGTKLTQDPANAECPLVDPKDYYGTYYGIDDWNMIQYTLTLNENGYELTVGSPLYSETKTGEYRYMTSEMVWGAFGQGYMKEYEHNAIVLIGEGGGTVYGFVETDSGLALENVKKEEILLKRDGMTLVEYMKGSAEYTGTYRYGSSNYLQLSANGKAILCLNGKVSNYSYFYASLDYIGVMDIGTKNPSATGAIILYTPGSSSYQSFEVVPGGLSYSNVLFAK